MLKIIAAIDQNNLIGCDKKLLWNLPEDIARFKNLTTNQVVAMGRKTFESLPEKYRPLPNRTNIVISRNTVHSGPNQVINCFNCLHVLDFAKVVNIWVIGGAQIYSALIKYADEIHVTEILNSFRCDGKPVYFPEFNETDFHRQESRVRTSKNGLNYRYVIYIRLKNRYNDIR